MNEDENKEWKTNPYLLTIMMQINTTHKLAWCIAALEVVHIVFDYIKH